MMLTIDLETYSPQDIGKVGAYRYAQDPDFEILLCSVAIDDYRVVLIDTTDNDSHLVIRDRYTFWCFVFNLVTKPKAHC